ncbi:hypothetical protein UlMin_042377 [Ulmus minor]
MAKAYDRVEWSFIWGAMKKLGFSEGWIKKIMACVTSVYYSLLINGEKVGLINPSRGLRQGDPLSPYLFLLCAEGLSSIIHMYERTGKLQGEDAIGRMVTILGVAQVKCHEYYLGLPYFSGKNKSRLFANIKDRVWNKLCGWKSKLLSAGGRETLTKAIIQAIPTYTINLFKILVSLIKELHQLCARFWWGGDVSKQKMH